MTAPRRREDVFATIPLYGADVNQHSKTVGECDETELLTIINQLVPDVAALVGNGDDAAVFEATHPVAVSCDMLVENRHFKRCWSTGSDIGWRAAMQNFADIAAMGASGTALIVALGMPPATPLRWLEDFARGLALACADASSQWERTVGIGGGDLTAASEIVVSVTALGEQTNGTPVVRAGAQVGDVVALCGTTGHSAAGLALGGPPPASAPGAVQQCWRTYLRPTPPLHAASALAQATAAMDVSDGLVQDATRIANASGVTIDLHRLTPDATLLDAAAYLDEANAESLARRWQLTGGEDHSLLATFPPQHVPTTFTPIGRVLPRAAQPLLVAGKQPPTLGGFDHFRR